MSQASFSTTSMKLSSYTSIANSSALITKDINLIFLFTANIRNSSLKSKESIFPFLVQLIRTSLIYLVDHLCSSITYTKSTSLIVLSSPTPPLILAAPVLPANTIFFIRSDPESKRTPYLIHYLTKYYCERDIIVFTISQVSLMPPVSIKWNATSSQSLDKAVSNAA